MILRGTIKDSFPRVAQDADLKRLKSFPILTLTGPRQSGKTTLARMLRPSFAYYSLEDPDTRAFSMEDPRGFLRQFSGGAIIDEVQRHPDLLSYLQGVVDASGEMGQFILTGSSQFELMESISQSLAGRTALLTLLPLSSQELLAVNRLPGDLDETLYTGAFPAIHDRSVEPAVWIQDYVGTYLERDVRSILNIHDLAIFQRFVQLCAGRVGQLINLSSLSRDAGINRATAQSWLSVLQASHLVHLVQPWFTNLSKRWIKTPKLYFCDAALAAWLLGVRRASHLTSHPLRGALFENWVITELIKSQTHRGEKPSIYFIRDKQGHEIDALIETGPNTFQAVEIKSGMTVTSESFSGLKYWGSQLTEYKLHPWIVYGGETKQEREAATVLPWRDLESLLEHRLSRKVD
jgi:uncharacterized protein